MEGTARIGESGAARRALRALRAHPLVTLLVAGAIVGGGLRFVPAAAATAPGSSGGAGSTACAAQ